MIAFIFYTRPHTNPLTGLMKAKRKIIKITILIFHIYLNLTKKLYQTL